MSTYSSVPLAPPDAIFHLAASCKADPDNSKINLGIGAYRDGTYLLTEDNGNPWVLPVVKKAELLIVNDASLDHEYLSIDGLSSFTTASIKLMLGEKCPLILNKCVASAQTVSGTGACSLAAARFLMAPVYIPNPTWGNHRSIFSDAGFTDIREYQYWDANNRSLDFKGVMDAFNNAPPKSIILLHPCAHNPTGVDPTTQQWIEIAAVCKKRSLIVFFDSAYQGQTFLITGFASGNLEQDAQAVRHFVNKGLEVLIAQSYSKNFGLYNERCGCLSVVTTSSQKAVEVSSQLCKLIRASYSNPPAFGARVVSLVLNTPALYAEWKIQLESMATRIIFMRKELLKHFLELKTPGTWTHIVSQIGMFSFTGLSTPQVKILKEKYHVYMTDNGRISMAGLNTKNVRRFAEAVDWVVRNVNSPKM